MAFGPAPTNCLLILQMQREKKKSTTLGKEWSTAIKVFEVRSVTHPLPVAQKSKI